MLAAASVAMRQQSMSEPCIITVAITGSVARKRHNKAVPESVSEQIESTHEAFDAGASLVHVHSRNDDGSPGTDPDKFAAFQEGIRKHCPGIIVQFSTGARSGVGAERGSMLHHRPDMASLSTGSCNFPKSIYENSNELIEELAGKMLEFDIKPEIEVFDLAMLYRAADLVAQGLLKSPLHVQFVLGVKNALPAHRDILEFELEKLSELLPDATWVAAGIGKSQLEVNRWCLELGGHMRTGLEDNIRLDGNTLAPSNAALVARAADLCSEFDRHPASASEARDILGLST
jgi:3-oxoadipate:acetyl-CoA acetyltransferase